MPRLTKTPRTHAPFSANKLRETDLSSVPHLGRTQTGSTWPCQEGSLGSLQAGRGQSRVQASVPSSM